MHVRYVAACNAGVLTDEQTPDDRMSQTEIMKQSKGIEAFHLKY